VRATADQLANRRRMAELFQASPLPVEDLLVNLPLYMRSSALAKVLWIDELYRLVVPIPGVVMEFGCWWGANLALLESLRAVHEPYNYARRVIGFDTFTGYTRPAVQDGTDDLVREGAYAVGAGYQQHLEALLDVHQRENPMPDLRKHELVAGDAADTVTEYLEAHPETVVALAYFDMQLYEPTKACLAAILPHVVPGSVIALDELGAAEFPGETLAFREAVGLGRYPMHRSRFLPDRSYVVVR
jgi:hypothetical protein